MTTITTAIAQVSCNYLMNNVLPELLPYNVQDGVQIPRKFSNMKAVKTFIAIINLRGYNYHQRNTKGNTYISYCCNNCKKHTSFSRKGDFFFPVKKACSLCDCPREGKRGNKRQCYTDEMAAVAISALFGAGIIDILNTDDATINKVLREHWDFFVKDDKLASRIKEFLKKEDPFRCSDFNASVSRICGNCGEVVIHDYHFDNSFDRCFMSLSNHVPPTEIWYVKGVSEEQNLEHYAAFGASETVPFAWGSARIDSSRDNDNWFADIVGHDANCNVINIDPCYNTDVLEVISGNYNAFGVAYSLFALCTSQFSSLGEILGKNNTIQTSQLRLSNEGCQQITMSPVQVQQVSEQQAALFNTSVTMYSQQQQVVYYLPHDIDSMYDESCIQQVPEVGYYIPAEENFDSVDSFGEQDAFGNYR